VFTVRPEELAKPASRRMIHSVAMFLKSVCRRSALHPDPCSCTGVRPLLGASSPKPRPRATGGPRNRHQGVPPPWTPRIFAAHQADDHHSRSATSCVHDPQLAPRDQDRNMGPHSGYYTWPLAWPFRLHPHNDSFTEARRLRRATQKSKRQIVPFN